MSIELNNEQKKLWAELIGYITSIEKAMAAVIDHAESENIAYCLNERIALLATSPRMMELATAIYNYAKGQAANEAMNNEVIFKAKQDIQRKWFDGKLAKYEGIYIRAERCSKDLFNQIEGLRSLLSYNKSLAIAT